MYTRGVAMQSLLLDQPSFFVDGVTPLDIKSLIDSCDEWYEKTQPYDETYFFSEVHENILYFKKVQDGKECYVRAHLFDTLYYQPVAFGTIPHEINGLPVLESYSPYFSLSERVTAQQDIHPYYGAIKLTKSLPEFIQTLARKNKSDIRSLNGKRLIVSKEIKHDVAWRIINSLTESYFNDGISNHFYYSQPLYARLFQSELIDKSKIVFLANCVGTHIVSVSLCVVIEKVVFAVVDFVLDRNTKVTKEATLANIEWAIKNNFEYFDMYNIPNNDIYLYKKKFFNGKLPIPLYTHGDCRWAFEHSLIG